MQQSQPQPPKAALPAAVRQDQDQIDKRFGYRSIRYNANPKEREAAEARSTTGWNHARPNSVLIAAMGQHWRPGCWQRVMDMVHYANQSGINANMEEVMDRCFNPYDSLGAMRNEAAMRASQGYEWLLYVDTDIQPEPEMLVRLVLHQMPICAPLVMEPETGKYLHGPYRERWTGLQPVRWCVLSMLLFHTGIFRATGPELWNDSIGADEGYHFQKLWHYGYRPYIDTNMVLTVSAKPTYPLATLRMKAEDREKFWAERREWLLAVPDRAPIDPADRRVNELGEYLPFIEPAQGTATVPQPVAQAMPVTGPLQAAMPVQQQPAEPAPVVQEDVLSRLARAHRYVAEKKEGANG